MIARLRRRLRAYRYARFSRRIDRFWDRYMAELRERHARSFEAAIADEITGRTVSGTPTEGAP